MNSSQRITKTWKLTALKSEDSSVDRTIKRKKQIKDFAADSVRAEPSSRVKKRTRSRKAIMGRIITNFPR
jgi:predicted helicase